MKRLFAIGACILMIFGAFLAMVTNNSYFEEKSIEKSLDEEHLHIHDDKGIAITLQDSELKCYIYEDGCFRMDKKLPNGQTMNLLYPGFTEHATSFWTWKIDNQYYKCNAGQLLSHRTKAPTAWGNPATNVSIEYAWGDLKINLTFTLLPKTMRWSIKATSTNSHTFGARYEYDTCVGELGGGADGAPIFVPTIGPVYVEKTFVAPQFDYVSGLLPNTQNPNNPELVAVCWLGPSLGATRPDKLTIAAWPNCYNTVWDYAINPSASITMDSAVMVYYNPVQVTATSPLEIVGFFGAAIPPAADYHGVEILDADCPFNANNTVPIKIIQPGGTASFNLTVWNVGNKQDTFLLSYDYCPPGWSVHLSTNSVSLTAGQTTKVKLNVTAPVEGVGPGDYANVSLVAVCQGTPTANDKMLTLTMLDLTYGITIKCVDENKIKYANCGEPVSFRMRVSNLGNVYDNATISVVNPAPPNWGNITITPSHVFLGPAGTGIDYKYVYVNTTAPLVAGANEQLQISVKAVSEGNPIKPAMETVTVVVNPEYGLTLAVEDPVQYANPGETRQYHLQIFNKGNTVDTIKLNITTSMYNFPNWSYAFENGDYSCELEVQSNQVKNTVLTLQTAPDWPPTVNIFEIRAQSINNISKVATAQITMCINQTHILQITELSNSGSVNPGDSFTAEFIVKNKGNGPEKLDVSAVSIPKGWTPEFRNSDDLVLGEDTFSIPYIASMEQQTYKFTVHVNSSARAGTYQCMINFTNELGLEIYSFAISVEVGQIFDMNLTGIIDRQRNSPGRVANFTVRLWNRGNGEDKADMSFASIPSEWIASYVAVSTEKDSTFLEGTPIDFDSPTSKPIDMTTVNKVTKYVPLQGVNLSIQHSAISVKLSPGQAVYITVTVKTPSKASAGLYNFLIVARSGGSKQQTLSLSVTLSDLQIQSIKYSNRMPSHNEILTITVTVYNFGEVDANFVEVKLYIDGVQKGVSDYIQLIPANKTAVAVLVWSAQQGNHKIKIEVDPEGVVPDLDRANNVKTESISVKSTKSSIPGLEVFGIIAAIACAAFLIHREKKNRC